MKNVIKMSVFVVSLLSLVRCGVLDKADRMLHQTEEMNSKMDQTNAKIDVTNGKMDQTNAKIDLSNAGIDKTTSAVHVQTLAVAVNSLLASENTEVLTPPTDMIALAEKFTEEATAHEIIQTFHLLYTSVMKGFESEANGDKKIQRRRVRLAAASALAGLASKEKANEILSEQIDREGEFLDTAYVFALCRYNFTKDFLLKPVLDPARTPNLKLLQAAQKHFLVVKGLAQTQYVDRLKVTIPEFVIKDKETGELGSLEDALNPGQYKSLARVALAKFDDKNNAKLQTPEAQELIAVFR